MPIQTERVTENNTSHKVQPNFKTLSAPQARPIRHREFVTSQVDRAVCINTLRIMDPENRELILLREQAEMSIREIQLMLAHPSYRITNGRLYRARKKFLKLSQNPPIDTPRISLAVLNRLPEYYWQVLLLQNSGHTVRQMAQILMIPEGTIGSRLTRAKRKVEGIVSPSNPKLVLLPSMSPETQNFILSKLPYRLRRIVVLKKKEDATHLQISNKLGGSEQASGLALYRARREFRSWKTYLHKLYSYALRLLENPFDARVAVYRAVEDIPSGFYYKLPREEVYKKLSDVCLEELSRQRAPYTIITKK